MTLFHILECDLLEIITAKIIAISLHPAVSRGSLCSSLFQFSIAYVAEWSTGCRRKASLLSGSQGANLVDLFQENDISGVLKRMRNLIASAALTGDISISSFVL